mmetsp:Transcript_61332/g.168417  ORF Transcript_61332/g.168417 Transcript_61332/m.168417 type:complete len:366 (-) Transcript_61332:1053-2150(-)
MYASSHSSASTSMGAVPRTLPQQSAQPGLSRGQLAHRRRCSSSKSFSNTSVRPPKVARRQNWSLALSSTGTKCVWILRSRAIAAATHSSPRPSASAQTAPCSASGARSFQSVPSTRASASASGWTYASSTAASSSSVLGSLACGRKRGRECLTSCHSPSRRTTSVQTSVDLQMAIVIWPIVKKQLGSAPCVCHRRVQQGHLRCTSAGAPRCLRSHQMACSVASHRSCIRSAHGHGGWDTPSSSVGAKPSAHSLWSSLVGVGKVRRVGSSVLGKPASTRCTGVSGNASMIEATCVSASLWMGCCSMTSASMCHGSASSLRRSVAPASSYPRPSSTSQCSTHSFPSSRARTTLSPAHLGPGSTLAIV